jgi:hypothetical protein
MDLSYILLLAKEFLVLIVVLAALLAYALARGNRALISLILGLYIALLISLKFPYYDALRGIAAERGAAVTIGLFAIFTALGTVLFERLLPRDYGDMYEGIGKKTILVVLATVLVMAYSYHVLPVTSIINPGSSISALFGPPEYFFWLMLLPLVGLFFI